MAPTTTIDLGPLARDLGLAPERVESAIRLLDDGNTVPFITRYRKDQTGGLDEVQIRDIESRINKLRQLAERKQTILRSIEAQNKLTPELAAQISGADSLKRLEDLYLPFKPKKQTLATAARERGLEPLAEEILAAAPACADLDARARDFINPDKQIKSIADVLLGVGHILAETFSERADVRGRLRKIFKRSGKLISTRVESADKKGEEAEEKKAAETLAQNAPAATEPAASAEPTTAVMEVAAAAVAHDDAANIGPPAKVETALAPESVAADGLDAEDHVEEAVAEYEGMLDKEQAEQTADAVEDLGTEETAKAPGAGNPAGVPVASGSPVIAPAVAASAPHPRAVEREKKKKAKDKAKDKLQEKLEHDFRDYFNYQEQVGRIPPHRVLAINRGEKAKILRVKLDADTDAMYHEADTMLVPEGHPHADLLRGCAKDALGRLVIPSLEREIRRELTENAETHAVEVFARNLRNLLLQPPVHNRRVLACDPGFKSGCKLAALDEFGNLLDHGVVHLVGREERKKEARTKLIEMIQKHTLNVVAIGNGTACRETEDLLTDILANELKDQGIAYVIVNEAGASVYSTSPLGREEFPNFDATLRGAISIGRRLLDPLSELVKIDPANIGVGLYQHDVKAKHLRTSLDAVIESCVNYVGVDLNTASPALLRYVSGLNQLTARRVYDHRLQHGPFKRRDQLKEVAGFGEGAFVQAAGFLKITAGENPLDAAWIHPESYDAAGKVLEKLESSATALAEKETPAQLAERAGKLDPEAVAQELHVGTLLLKDIVAQLARPGRDPREDLPPPIFKRGVLKLDDLTPGMELTGSVLNVVDFGAFVDIGLHDSGLVHISQLANKYVRDPHEVVAVGGIVKVWVLEIDKTRRRVSLTMIPPGTPRTPPQRHAPAQEGEGRRHERRPPRPPRPATAGQGQPQGEAAQSGQPAQSNQGGNTGQSGRGGQGYQGQGQQGQRPPRRDGGHGKPPFKGGRTGGRDKPSFTPPPPKPKPKPLIPITKKMVEGKEPMRTFGDLLQFVKIKTTPEDAPPEKSKEPPAALTPATEPAPVVSEKAKDGNDKPAVANEQASAENDKTPVTNE